MKDKEKEALDCAKKIKEYCGSVSCYQCVFFGKNTMCHITERSPETWCLDNTPKKRLTDKQKLLLSLLDERWKYIAKDESGTVYIYEFKPNKREYYFKYTEGNIYNILNLYGENMFDFLSWEDEEATLIEDLLK